MDHRMTAAELEFEAMLESRLEAITTRVQAFTSGTQSLFTETMDLSKTVQSKAQRLYYIEDYILRLQGKPGLPSQHFQQGGRQPRKHQFGIGNAEFEEAKMGVKTLRRKFQAAGVAVTTIGWWRHLKDKKATEAVANLEAVPIPSVPSTPSPPSSQPRSREAVSAAAVEGMSDAGGPAKLTIDTSAPVAPASFEAGESPEASAPAAPMKGIMTPSAIKKRNTLPLQQIFYSPTAATPAKGLHSHYVNSPSTERAHPSLGLFSPPMSPNGPGGAANENAVSLMRGLSLHS
ncbi:hypothetical protein BGW38_007594 [Lunasporangiospora selenospora]|uniref:Uncharacterized protein n=1 Tax=Lunasporangiospora selenospora TaxID=979761 RepID=A0A9P6FZ46_9FUNG|nr:hypothetical protein BGW38_007594 [Lunasporangiospora selenospora]